MIVVRVEIWPHGVAEAAREVARVTIANDGTGTEALACYDVAAEEGDRVRSGELRDHRRGAGVLPLVRDAIDAVLRGE